MLSETFTTLLTTIYLILLSYFRPRAQIYFADEERLAALFYKLDYYKDGHVTVEELEKYLEEKEMKVTRDEIEVSKYN